MVIQSGGAAEGKGKVLARSRNFYGTLAVLENFDDNEPLRQLFHGPVLHGSQYTDLKRRHVPTAYYRPQSGAGLAMQVTSPRSRRRVGVVGLGAGTLAAYGKPNDRFTFYEINPAVDELARKYFTFLADSRASVDVVLGDARISLEREPPQAFDVLVLDAFSGDSIPTHLLTVEAFKSYRHHLKPTGIIAVHISNLYLDLYDVVGRLAEEAEMRAFDVEDPPAGEALVSEYILLTSDPDVANELQKRSKRVSPTPGLAWNDDYSAVLTQLRHPK